MSVLIWFLPIFLVILMLGLPVFFALMAAPGGMLLADGAAVLYAGR
jgi:hypothetical protein